MGVQDNYLLDEEVGSASVAPASAKFWGTNAVEADEEGAWRCELPGTGGSWALVLTREDCKVLAYKTLAVVVLSYLLLPLVAVKKEVYPFIYTSLLIITHVGVLILYFYKVKYRKLDGSWRSLTARILALAFCIGLLFVVANHEKTGNMAVLAAYVTGLILVHALILVLLTVRAVRSPPHHHVPIL
eukprot:CAMPEP_0197492874 /NCGR_PEP_ID=MMETSP1311-20131121/16427_1 /TAXON_ID=464262 /ORGANISM="Genus nov. species nov., Strain RCC856" /LENGTH=185 /DNA_ID=CAMNT_0043038001 /DNA_START=38 /DNA_END=595 /DNA_ORIENTATION=+